MGAGSRIRSIVATAIELELSEPFAIAKGAATSARNVVVTLELEDGTEGLGEAAPFTAVSGETQAGVLEAVNRARPALLGQDARAHLRLVERLSLLLPRDPAARCALEMALVDAVARQHGVPLWLHFGGVGSEVHTDLTITAGGAAHASEAATRALARGISTLKVKVGGLSPQADAERMQAVQLAAPGAHLLADANGGYSVAEALQFLTELERRGVPLDLFEQPVEPRDWLALLALVPRERVLLCADESARSADEVLALALAGALPAVNLKPMKTGVAETLRIWHIARAAKARLMIGGMVESPLAMSFSAHLAAGLGGFDFVDLDTPMFMTSHPFQGGFVQHGARLDVSHVAAGHGVTWAAGSRPSFA